MANDESYLDETPLSPLGFEIIDTSEQNNPHRFRVDESVGQVEIYMTDRFSVFGLWLDATMARSLAVALNRLADKIESETTE